MAMSITLSMAMMANGVKPSVRIFRAAGRLRPPRSSRIAARLPRRKITAPAALAIWESTVASAAPRTPMFSAKMNTGSSAMFSAAPSTTSRIACAAKPCAIIIWFSPAASSAKTVPVRYTVK